VWLKGVPILFLDTRLSSQEASEVAARVLGTFSLDDVYVKPAVRHLLEVHGNGMED